MQKKKRKIRMILLPAILLFLLTGCAKFGSIINDIRE